MTKNIKEKVIHKKKSLINKPKFNESGCIEKNFKNSLEMSNQIYKYFAAVSDNPIKVQNLIPTGRIQILTHKRPFTVRGLCAFLGIDRKNWFDLKKHHGDYASVIEWAENIIYDDNFSGACIEIYNTDIIKEHFKRTP